MIVKKQPESFKPVTFTITVETPYELEILKAMSNVSVNGLKEANLKYTNDDVLFINTTTTKLYEMFSKA